MRFTYLKFALEPVEPNVYQILFQSAILAIQDHLHVYKLANYIQLY